MLNQFEIIELDVIDGTRASVRRHPRRAYPFARELQYCCNRCLCVHSYILTRIRTPAEAPTYQFCCCRNARDQTDTCGLVERTPPQVLDGFEFLHGEQVPKRMLVGHADRKTELRLSRVELLRDLCRHWICPVTRSVAECFLECRLIPLDDFCRSVLCQRFRPRAEGATIE
jgi:hypothetical protein